MTLKNAWKLVAERADDRHISTATLLVEMWAQGEITESQYRQMKAAYVDIMHPEHQSEWWWNSINERVIAALFMAEATT